jgi:hypothetical protein
MAPFFKPEKGGRGWGMLGAAKWMRGRGGRALGEGGPTTGTGPILEEAGVGWPRQEIALGVGVRLGQERGGVWAVFWGCGLVALGRPEGAVAFLIYSNIFKSTWINSIKRRSCQTQKISNKICICRESNKEQLILLGLFKIRDLVWINNHGSSRIWKSIGFDGIWLEIFLNWSNLNKKLLIALGWHINSWKEFEISS